MMQLSRWVDSRRITINDHLVDMGIFLGRVSEAPAVPDAANVTSSSANLSFIVCNCSPVIPAFAGMTGEQLPLLRDL